MTRSLPAHYRQAPFDENCAPRRILRLFSGKWTTMILHTLHLLGGYSRPGQLQRSIPGLSKKMMTQTLRELEEKGLINRQIHQIMPPNVEYSLTALGKVFVEPIEQLYLWGIDHAEALEALETNERLAATAQEPLEAAE
nr:helix-turn-helix domain-containing protein [Gluconobacter frateurii]